MHLSGTQPSQVSLGASSCAQLCVQQETTNGCLCTARYRDTGLNQHSSLLCPSFAASALSPAALDMSRLCKHSSVPLQDIPVRSGTSGYCRKTSLAYKFIIKNIQNNMGNICKFSTSQPPFRVLGKKPYFSTQGAYTQQKLTQF